MYNLPYIAYGVFAIVVIVSFVLGLKKGLRYTIYSFGVLLVSSGIAVGLSFAVYPFMRDWLARIMRSSYSGSTAYDYTYLVDATRPQMMAAVICVFAVALCPIVYGVSYALAKLVKRLDLPKTVRQISTNTRQVVMRSPRAQKVTTIGINTVMALCSASMVTTAITPIITRPNNYNVFNAATGALSRAMTFGYGYTSQDMTSIYTSIPLTNDAALMRGFAYLLIPGETPLSTTDIDGFNNSPNLSALVHLLQTNDTYALANFFNSAFHNALWKPLGNEDQQANPVPLATLKSTMERLHLHASSSAVNNLITWIHEHAIQQFTATKVYSNFTNLQQQVLALNQQLSKANQELSRRLNRVKNLPHEITAMASQRNALVGKINKQIDRYRLLTKSNGLIDQKTASVNSQSTIVNAKQDELTHQLAILSQYEDAKNTAANKLQQAKDAYQNSPHDENLHQEYLAANRTYNSAVNSLHNQATLTNKAQKALDDANATSHNLTNALNILERERDEIRSYLLSGYQNDDQQITVGVQLKQTEYWELRNGEDVNGTFVNHENQTYSDSQIVIATDGAGNFSSASIAPITKQITSIDYQKAVAYISNNNGTSLPSNAVQVPFPAPTDAYLQQDLSSIAFSTQGQIQVLMNNRHRLNAFIPLFAQYMSEYHKSFDENAYNYLQMVKTVSLS